MIDFNNFDIDVLVLYIVFSIFREVPVGTFALVGAISDCCERIIRWCQTLMSNRSKYEISGLLWCGATYTWHDPVQRSAVMISWRRTLPSLSDGDGWGGTNPTNFIYHAVDIMFLQCFALTERSFAIVENTEFNLKTQKAIIYNKPRHEDL